MMKKIGKMILGILTAVGLVTGSVPANAEGYTELNELASGLESDFVYAVDFDNGQVLLDKHGTEKMYPASMTKIMTVILAIEHYDDWDEHVEVTQEAVDDLGDATIAGFWAGDLPTVRDLIYASMMLSAADATNAIAVGVSGSIPAFVEAMNSKAKEIGMKNTHFVNTSGMHNENHYSTCEDIAILLKYCIANEDFRAAADRESYQMTPCSEHPNGLYLESSAWNSAREYGIPGFRGAKAGYTGMAGHCLAAWCEFNGMSLGIVTAHADTDYYAMTHYEDTAAVAKTLYADYERTELDVSNYSFGTVRVHRLLTNKEYPIRNYGTFHLDARKGLELRMGTVDFPEGVMASSKEQTVRGTVGAFDGNSLIYETEISVTIPAESNGFVVFFSRIGGMFTLGLILLSALCGVLLLVRKKPEKEE